MAHSSALSQPLRQSDFLRLLEKHCLFIWLVILDTGLFCIGLYLVAFIAAAERSCQAYE